MAISQHLFVTFCISLNRNIIDQIMAFILDLKGTTILTDSTPLVANNNNNNNKIKDDGEDTAARIPAATGFQMRDVLEGNDDGRG
jgi:hypothetical protein